MLKEPKKIENSVHKKFILDCIEKGLSAAEIEKQLLTKGVKLTSPTIRTFMKYVKQQGINVTQFKLNFKLNPCYVFLEVFFLQCVPGDLKLKYRTLCWN